MSDAPKTDDGFVRVTRDTPTDRSLQLTGEAVALYTGTHLPAMMSQLKPEGPDEKICVWVALLSAHRFELERVMGREQVTKMWASMQRQMNARGESEDAPIAMAGEGPHPVELEPCFRFRCPQCRLYNHAGLERLPPEIEKKVREQMEGEPADESWRGNVHEAEGDDDHVLAGPPSQLHCIFCGWRGRDRSLRDE